MPPAKRTIAQQLAAIRAAYQSGKHQTTQTIRQNAEANHPLAQEKTPCLPKPN